MTFLLHLLHLLLQLHGAGEVAVAVGEHANKQPGQDVESVDEVAGAASSTAVAGLVKLQQRVCLRGHLRVLGGICGE